MTPLENASYAWQGPNNTIFNGQNLTINNLLTSQSGEYKAYYTVDGCESFFDTLFIQVNPTPEVYIGLSDTLCDVSDIILDAGFGDLYSYLWQDNSTEPIPLIKMEPILFWLQMNMVVLNLQR
jgi:hypothetical protein